MGNTKLREALTDEVVNAIYSEVRFRVGALPFEDRYDVAVAEVVRDVLRKHRVPVHSFRVDVRADDREEAERLLHGKLANVEGVRVYPSEVE